MKSSVTYACALVLTVALSTSQGQEYSVSPEADPERDPMRPTIPVLYLSGAGKLPQPETRLTSFSEVGICPDDYAAGWTVRCETSMASYVIFRVNGVESKRQNSPPFYLAGDYNGRASPFKLYEDVKRARIACLVSTRKPVWVDFIVTC